MISIPNTDLLRKLLQDRRALVPVAPGTKGAAADLLAQNASALGAELEPVKLGFRNACNDTHVANAKEFDRHLIPFVPDAGLRAELVAKVHPHLPVVGRLHAVNHFGSVPITLASDPVAEAEAALAAEQCLRDYLAEKKD